MKILFVIDSLAGGGAERSLVETIPAIRAAGHAVVVVPLDERPGSLAEEAKRAGASIVQLSARHLLHRTFQLHRVIKKERPTIVHTSLYVSDQVGRVAAVCTGARVISSLVNTVYDPVRLDDPNVRRSRLELARLIDGWTARHLTVHLHATSNAVKHSSSRALRIPAAGITVIERGRDPERLGVSSPERRLRTRARLGIPTDARVVVTVGRQEFQKGQEHLVAAFDRVAADDERAFLLIVGRPGHASTVLAEALGRSKHRDRIRVLGQRGDVADIVAASDVFGFPSRYEGFGGALVEAMALAIPAVVSDIPAMREIVDGTAAILVPPGDPIAMADAIGTLLDDPARAADLGARARAMFLDRFTVERSTARMLRLYEDVAGDVERCTTSPATQPRHPPELISVVVPVLNEAAMLPDQLAALAAQTYRGRWEVIVCDNGSNDGTREVAASWADRLPELRVADASDRRGLNHTRNVGARSARGDFLAFCDGDDVVSPDWLQALSETAPCADIVAGALDTEHLNGGASSGRQVADRLPVKHEFLAGVSGGNCGVWRSVATQLGWDERFTYGGSDIEFAWRAQLSGYRIAYEPRAIIRVRDRQRLGDVARQWYRYGESGGLLFRTFRHEGMRRSRFREAVRTWAWLLVHVADVRGSASARRRWVRIAAYRAGRLAGSIRERTLFL